MKYDVKNDTAIMNDINVLKSYIDLGNIFIDITQRNKRQRIGPDISQCISKILKKAFKEHKPSYNCIKDLTINNKSPKEPYEILLNVELDGELSDVYVNLLPTNKLKHSSPFIGSINKYINRLKSGHIYDMIFFIKYESEKDKEPSNYDINYVFVKDINKISLYKNWQLQVNIQTLGYTKNTTPQKFITILSGLLDKLGVDVTQKITQDCKDKKNELSLLKF